MSEFHAIAIDGPAASGKSSVARRVAQAFGFNFVNSGAMYRAVTWLALEQGVSPSDSKAVVDLLNQTEFGCGVRDGESTIAINGRELDTELHGDAVNENVSAISAIPEVRERQVAEQRRYRDVANVVMEGRDIGTVVFPDTPYKFYLDASSEVRARRRGAQGIVDNIRRRDQLDSTRKTAPLRVAKDALVIDTSYLSLDEVVEKVVFHLRARGLKPCEPEFPPTRMTSAYLVAVTLARWLSRNLYGLDRHHSEKANFPGGCFVAANHTSFLDPPLTAAAMDEAIYFLARKSLFDHPLNAKFYPDLNAIPLNQDRPDLSTMRTIIQLVKNGSKVLIFPEGERSYDGQLLPAQRGVGMLIAKSRAPVLPIRIFGAHEIYPRGSKRPKPTGKLDVVFGDPIYFSEEEFGRGKQGYQAISDRVVAEIAKLKLPGAK